MPAKPSSYFGCIWQDKIFSTQTQWFCILTLCILQQYLCVKIPTQSAHVHTGHRDVLCHVTPWCWKQERTGQNSLLASTEALLKAVPHQFPFGVLSAESWSCFYGSNVRTNKYLQEIFLFGKQLSTCSGNPAAPVTSLWYCLVASTHPLWKTLSSVCIGVRAHAFRHIISLCGFPSCLYQESFHRAGHSFSLPNPSIPFSLRAYFGCQWTQKCSRRILFLQPALLSAIPWMYFCSCIVRGA